MANRTFPARPRSCVRPRASTLRTSSASKPTPAENPKRLSLTRPSEMRRVLPCEQPARGSDGVARQPERARQHACTAAGDEADRRAAGDAVQRLVEAAVPREDVDRLDLAVRLARELGRVAGALRDPHVHVTERSRDAIDELVGDPRREWIDDQDGPCHAGYRLA